MPLWKFVFPVQIAFSGTGAAIEPPEPVGLILTTALRDRSSFRTRLQTVEREKISCGLRMCTSNGDKESVGLRLYTTSVVEMQGAGMYLSTMTDIQPLIGSVFTRLSCVLSGEAFV